MLSSPRGSRCVFPTSITDLQIVNNLSRPQIVGGGQYSVPRFTSPLPILTPCQLDRQEAHLCDYLSQVGEDLPQLNPPNGPVYADARCTSLWVPGYDRERSVGTLNNGNNNEYVDEVRRQFTEFTCIRATTISPPLSVWSASLSRFIINQNTLQIPSNDSTHPKQRQETS